MTGGPEQDSWQVVGGPDHLRPAATRAARCAVRLGVASSRLEALELAVHECLVNAFEHGHLGRHDLPILVEVVCDDHGAVCLRIEDAALGGDWDPAPRPSRVASTCLSERGRGWTLITAGADDVATTASGGRTCVELRLG